jgi:hypothetical protein
LQQFRIGNQVRANYRYDFFERLNWRQTVNMTPAGAAHYLQDLQGQLIVEATDTGMPLRTSPSTTCRCGRLEDS